MEERRNRETRKKSSENSSVAREVGEEKVGMATDRAEEEGAEEGVDDAHYQRIPGTARPHVHQGKKGRGNDDRAGPEVGGPGEKGDKQREKFPEGYVKGRRGRKPSDAADRGRGNQRQPKTPPIPKADAWVKKGRSAVKTGGACRTETPYQEGRKEDHQGTAARVAVDRRRRWGRRVTVREKSRRRQRNRRPGETTGAAKEKRPRRESKARVEQRRRLRQEARRERRAANGSAGRRATRSTEAISIPRRGECGRAADWGRREGHPERGEERQQAAHGRSTGRGGGERKCRPSRGRRGGWRGHR